MFQNKIVRRRLITRSFRGYTYMPIVASSVTRVEDGWARPVSVLIAYGTSEGVKKGWDARGRGRRQEHAFQPFYLRDDVRQMPAKEAEEMSRQQIVKGYESMGDRLTRLHDKLEDPRNVKSTAWKFLHLLRSIGDWADQYKNLAELSLGAYFTVKLAMTQFAAHHSYLLQVLTWAHQHIMPVVQAMAAQKGISLGGL